MFDPVSARPAGFASVAITCVPDAKEFAITTEPAMPAIQVKASLVGATAATSFEWTATLEFDPAQCTNGAKAAVNPPQTLTGIAPTGEFTVQFPQIRGGRLTIRVKARVGNEEIVGERKDLKIVGTNPKFSELTDALPSRVFRALVWHESRGRQFLGPNNGGTGACPLYSGDQLGGVGLMQITRPAPTLDQTWNWRANIKAGLALFEDKKTTARAWAKAFRNGTEFKALVDAYNAERTKQRLPAVQVTIPDFTEEQVDVDALRGYNGWAAKVHEFRPALEPNGLLAVTLSPDGVTGTARWEQVPLADRNAALDAAGITGNRRGDPNYVRNIMKANVPY
jgi:hypothetical protein